MKGNCFLEILVHLVLPMKWHSKWMFTELEVEMSVQNGWLSFTVI